jgi:hypothetical protein
MNRKTSAPPSSTAATAPPKPKDGRVLVDGKIIKLTPAGRPVLRMKDGRQVVCRCASTIDVGWLRAALVVGSVDAEGTYDASDGSGSIWCVFPGPEHADVAVPTLSFAASERIALRCGKSSVALEKDGSLQVRGRDVLTRGSRSTRVSGGTVRIN